MPWCPKCKMEYRKGITDCSDCKIELVELLQESDDLVPFFQAEQEKVAEKLVHYFDYSGLKATIQFDEENQVFVVMVPEDQFKNAKKLYQAFYFVEREKREMEANDTDEYGINPMNDDNDDNDDDSEASDDKVPDEEMQEVTLKSDDDEEEIESTSNAAYVMKSDQYKDLSSTVWIFSLFGFAGLIVVFLNLIGILGFLHGILPNLIMTSLFLFFIYTGISSYHKAKRLKSEIEEEDKLTQNINQWLELNITERFLASIHDDNVSEELNYLQKTAQIRKMLIKEFGQQNTSYLDRVIEEYYNDTFEA